MRVRVWRVQQMTADKETTVQAIRTGQPDATESDQGVAQSILSSVSADAFDEWYQDRQFTENIRNGTPYFNGPSEVKPPDRQSPSSLLQCHRKKFYNELNAPAEEGDPRGIFWIGSRFEEEVALPFLREAVAGTDEYVTNSLWVDFTVQTEAGEVQIRGETDPVIVDPDSKPKVLTEIKSKKSVSDVETPSSHHRAQAHAYMYGLSQEYDRQLTDALIIYGGRTNLNIQPFHVTFDPVFWRQTVLDWAAEHTSYRLRDELPPADPEHDWECTFCSYRERCGKGSSEYEDTGASGFLPGVATYPRSKVTEYLDAHDGAKLTPTLAHQYPELATRYQVLDWHCVACSTAFAWDDPEWDGEPATPPLCPECKKSGTPAPLRAPSPEQQASTGGDLDG